MCVCGRGNAYNVSFPTPGLSLTQDSKTNAILVKSVKGTVRKDGRIRAGDQILAINHESLENVSLPKAQKMLKKASSKSDGVTMTYLPAPHIHGFSSLGNSYGAKQFEKPPTARVTTREQQSQQQHFIPNQPLQQNLPPGGPSLHNIPEQDSYIGGQTQNVNMAPPSHPNMMRSQIAPPTMSQWTSYPMGPGAAISPMQAPSYNYQLPQATQQTYSQPLGPVMWQMQQPAPQQVAWILREPPRYADHMVQQHMMSAGGHYQLPQSGGPVSVPTLPPPNQGAPPPSLSSQPPPLSLSTQSHPPPPPPHQAVSKAQQTTTAQLSHMTNTQSEMKHQSAPPSKAEPERRRKNQGGASPRHPPHPYTVYRRRQQQQAQAAAAAAAAAAKQPPLIEEPSQPRRSGASGSHDKSHDRSHDYVHNMSHDLSLGNEEGGGGGGRNSSQRYSIDREVEEDPELRKEFPNVKGILFEVWLNKGNRGLGMSIVANRNDHAPVPRGIVIMGIQAGGVADRSRRIMWGDMILKINDTCVIGKTQQDVQEMLTKAPSNVRFVMLRQTTEGKVLEKTVSV